MSTCARSRVLSININVLIPQRTLMCLSNKYSYFSPRDSQIEHHPRGRVLSVYSNDGTDIRAIAGAGAPCRRASAPRGLFTDTPKFTTRAICRQWWPPPDARLSGHTGDHSKHRRTCKSWSNFRTRVYPIPLVLTFTTIFHDRTKTRHNEGVDVYNIFSRCHPGCNQSPATFSTTSALLVVGVSWAIGIVNDQSKH